MARHSKKTNKKRLRRRHWLDEETSENLPATIPIDLNRLSKEQLQQARNYSVFLRRVAENRSIAAIRDGLTRRRPKRRPKRKAKQGAAPTYDRDAIREVAREAQGNDDHRTWFYERVRELCAQRQPPIKAPANDRTLGRYIGDLYRPTKR